MGSSDLSVGWAWRRGRCVGAGEGGRGPQESGYHHLIPRTSPMTDPTSCCRVHGGYCQRCDVLVGLVGLHVTGVERTEGGLR